VIRPNANIAVIAPAGAPDPADLDKGIALLGEWGYRVTEGKHLRARHRYNAGTIKERSADLVWALTDANIDAVWLARGGYGCIQCLASLPMKLPQSRVVIGCSDATALLVALSARGHSQLIHGPMVEGLVSRADDETRKWIRHLLSRLDVPSIEVRHFCGRLKDVAGPLIGGNLTVLASMAGTPYSLHSEEGIVVLEDIGEALYRLDRSVTQLRLSGALRNARAIVLGQFIRCQPPKEATFTLDEVLMDVLEPLGIPVFSTTEIGHGARNRGWRYGGGVSIQGGAMQFDFMST
jgi:muramoyltetrapeptide carboxypeptidase